MSSLVINMQDQLTTQPSGPEPENNQTNEEHTKFHKCNKNIQAIMVCIRDDCQRNTPCAADKQAIIHNPQGLCIKDQLNKKIDIQIPNTFVRFIKTLAA